MEIGDRWGQSPDGLKGHEVRASGGTLGHPRLLFQHHSFGGISDVQPQYVYPLQFNADGTINHITWNDTVTFEVAVAAAA